MEGPVSRCYHTGVWEWPQHCHSWAPLHIPGTLDLLCKGSLVKEPFSWEYFGRWEICTIPKGFPGAGIHYPDDLLNPTSR
jgi:hypothetical protein